jgi:Ca-activated chloride channel family protein
VEASQDLPRIFAAELGDVLSVVARNVLVEIECPNGTRPIRIIGRDGRVGKDRVELQLNQLYGKQQKYALVEIEVPAGTAEDVREIAVARCTYENAITRKPEAASARARARFSRDRQEVIQSANNDVQLELIRNENALAKDEAVDLWNAGRQKEAVLHLKQKGLDNYQRAQLYGLEGQQLEEGNELNVEAENLEREGMDTRTKKAYRAGSYQTRSQQYNQ